MSEQQNNVNSLLAAASSSYAGINLFISSLVPTTSDDGEEQILNLVFSIGNNGDTEAGASLAYIYDGTTLLGSVEIEAIAAGSTSKTYTYALTSLSAGEHTLKVTANGDGAITEVMTMDNSKTLKIASKINNIRKTIYFDLGDRIVAAPSSTINTVVYNLTQKYTVWGYDLDSEGKLIGAGVVQQQSDADTAVQIQATSNNNCTDLIFAKASGTWEAGYFAQHVGTTSEAGLNACVALEGKNQISDLYFGSTNNQSLLYLTDDTCGDALFLDDIFTALPSTVFNQQARISKINVIYAGAGDDIVDLTSQRFAFSANSIEIHGGDGNDYLWSNSTCATLLGEAGDDCLIGGASDDFLSGGCGNDSLHGDGGNDTFIFGENWGTDQVQQLTGGNVTLWFAEDESCIQAEDIDGNAIFTNQTGDKVTVLNYAVAEITCNYGDDESDTYDKLLAIGAFQ